jgi:hypothetical protein
MTKKIEELIQMLECFIMDYVETKDSIYIILKSEQLKINKTSGKIDNKHFPTIDSILTELKTW